MQLEYFQTQADCGPGGVLIFREDDYTSFRRSLLRADGMERACFALLGVSQGEDRYRFMVQSLYPFDDSGYEHFSSASLTLRPEKVLAIRRDFLASPVLGILDAHSHPFTQYASFSGTDNHFLLAGNKSDFIGSKPEATYLRIVCGQAEEGFTAEAYFDLDGPAYPISEIHIVGKNGFRKITAAWKTTYDTFHPIQYSRIDLQKYDRSIREIGMEGQQKVAETKIGIIGCGGIGNLLALVAIRAGFRRFVLIDDDLVEVSNLNRLLDIYDKSVGKAKAEELRDALLKYEPSASIQVVTARLQTAPAQKALVGCDLLVNGLDNIPARHAIQLFAALHLMPMLDLGSEIHLDQSKKKVIARGSQALFYAPAEACLLCQGLDLAHVHSAQQEANLRAAGYIAGTRETPPAVIAINGQIASLGIDLLIRYLTDPGQMPQGLHYDALRYRILRLCADKNPDCPICGAQGIEGQGWSEPPEEVCEIFPDAGPAISTSEEPVTMSDSIPVYQGSVYPSSFLPVLFHNDFLRELIAKLRYQ